MLQRKNKLIVKDFKIGKLIYEKGKYGGVI